jgi:hypothetical protein
VDNKTPYRGCRLRPLGLIPLIALGLLSTLATGGGGGGAGPIPGPPGIIQLLETSYDASEGAIVNILVNRSGGSSGVVSVDYATVDGTAVGASDYTVSSGALTWLDGLSGNQTISIAITEDVTGELSESFTVTLSDVSGATLGVNSSATVTITDDDVTARLSDLSFSAGEFDQIFQPSLTGYTVTVSLLIPTVTVMPIPEDPNATITVNAADVASGEPSQKLTLDQGINTIDVVVTAIDGTTSEIYSIDVTRLTAASFGQTAYVKASNTDEFDAFSHALALHGDTLVVTADDEMSAATGVNGNQLDNSADNAGAGYVFGRDQSGVWSQQAFIKASNTEPFDSFGRSVALFGDTLAIGAHQEGSSARTVNGDQADNSRGGAGAVYVFTSDDAGNWTQQAYIKASNTVLGMENPGRGDEFGWSVALHGDTLAVGAVLEDSGATGINGDQSDNSVDSSGAVYIFTRDEDDAWSQQA